MLKITTHKEWCWAIKNQIKSESISKQYNDFVFCQEKFIDNKKNIDLQSQAIPWWQKKSKKSLHILEDSASGVQVGDVEQVIV